MSKEKMREYNLNRRLADPIGALLRGAKKRANMKKIEFNITKEDLGTPPEFCPVFGFKLKYDHIGRRINESASIDRSDNSKGYIPGNVRLISHRANELKNNGTYEEFLQLTKYMEVKSFD